MKPIDPRVQKFATDTERTTLDALEAHAWDRTHAAASLEIPVSALDCRLRRLRRRAAKQGIAPDSDMHVEIPDGFNVRGHSTYYAAVTDPETGEVTKMVPKNQWVKTERSREQQAVAMRTAAEEMAAPFRGTLDPIPMPADTTDDAMAVHLIGDHHFGMLSWAAETGESYDLEIAEATLRTAIDYLIERAPPTRQAMLVGMGDLFHANGAAAKTPASGNLLDVDGRFPRVVAVVVRVIRWALDRLLEKHGFVRGVFLSGNHDPEANLWLSIMLSALYENDPRVEIDTSPALRRYHRFGSNLFGFTHGHTGKIGLLPSLMAHERAAEWGSTDYHQWYTAHRNNQTVHTFPGCKLEVLEVLPPGDAWHVAEGYVGAGRSMRVDLWDRAYGPAGSIIADIKRIHARIKGDK